MSCHGNRELSILYTLVLTSVWLKASSDLENFFSSQNCVLGRVWYGVWFSDQKLRRAKKTQVESIAICHCHQYIDTPTAHPLHIFFYQAQLAFHYQSSWYLSLAFSAFFLLSTVWYSVIRTKFLSTTEFFVFQQSFY